MSDKSQTFSQRLPLDKPSVPADTVGDWAATLTERTEPSPYFSKLLNIWGLGAGREFYTLKTSYTLLTLLLFQTGFVAVESALTGIASNLSLPQGSLNTITLTPQPWFPTLPLSRTQHTVWFATHLRPPVKKTCRKILLFSPTETEISIFDAHWGGYTCLRLTIIL